MDKELLTLLSEGELFLLSLARHEQDELIATLPEWQRRVEAYVAKMAEYSSSSAQQKGGALLSLAQRLEQAFKVQAEWIQKQQYQVQQQHLAAQKYTKNI